MIRVDITATVPVRLERQRLRQAVRAILRDAQVRSAEVSLAVVSDQQIQQLNRRYLQHDYPTDVLSFRLDDGTDPVSLEGEVVVSWDTACRTAERIGWRSHDELLLYVIHGCLHLVGYQDHTSAERKQMRAREAEYLGRLDPRLAAIHLSHTGPRRRAARRIKVQACQVPKK